MSALCVGVFGHQRILSTNREHIYRESIHDKGKPVARRGRKATDLSREVTGLPKGELPCIPSEKPNSTSYLLHWPQTFRPPTLVSMDDGRWGPAGDYFHADYLAGVQNEFNYATDRDRDGRVENNNNNERALIDLCLNSVPNSVDVAHTRCGPEPGN